MPIRADLVIPRGQAWAGPLWALVGDQGEAVSLLGRTVHAQARAALAEPEVLHEWSTARGNAVVTPVEVSYLDEEGAEHTVTTDAVSLLVPASVSAAWKWEIGVYDVLVLDPTNPDATYGIVEESVVRVEHGVTTA